MNSLVTYDLEEKIFQESKHSQVKAAMKARGYMDSFIAEVDGKKSTYYLPNTTLWKQNIEPATAKKDLLEVAAQNGAIVERLFASQFAKNWVGLPGKPYVKK